MGISRSLNTINRSRRAARERQMPDVAFTATHSSGRTIYSEVFPGKSGHVARWRTVLSDPRTMQLECPEITEFF